MNTLPAKTPHRFFSPARIWAISTNTLLELVRLKVFYFLLLFALIIIGMAGFSEALNFQIQDQFQMIEDSALASMSIFTFLLAALTTANILPKDIEDRTLYTILAKPVPRFEYLLGKLLGIFLLLLVAVLLMSGMFLVALYAKHQSIAEATMREYTGARAAELPSILKDLNAHAFPTSLIPCIALIYIRGVILASLTMLISTFSTSYLFSVCISCTWYFIGSMEHVARDYLSIPTVGQGIKLFIIVVALFFPDLHLFDLVDDITAGNHIAMSLFLKTAGLGCSYIFVYSLVAYVVFAFKEL